MIPRPAQPTVFGGSRVHVPALDGLRGIAILLVMLHHYTIIRPATALDATVAHYLLVGWAGVDLFFVLSGFLITGLLYDDRGAPGYFRRFYARRTLRIFPLYYLVVFLSLVVLPRFPAWNERLAGPVDLPLLHDAAYWLYLSNLSIAVREAFQHGILGVSWSLAIEEQFYLLWAPVVWLLARRGLLRLAIGLVAGALFLRLALVDAGVHQVWPYVITPARVDALAVGALVALLVRSPDTAALARWSGPAAGVLLAATMVLVSTGENNWWYGREMQGPGYTLVALAAGATLCFVVLHGDGAWAARALSTPGLRMFGKYSYALYLFHLPAMRIVREFVFDPRQAATVAGSQLPAQLLFYLVAALPALGAAWLSWRYFEAPILRLKDRFPYGR